MHFGPFYDQFHAPEYDQPFWIYTRDLELPNGDSLVDGEVEISQNPFFEHAFGDLEEEIYTTEYMDL